MQNGQHLKSHEGTNFTFLNCIKPYILLLCGGQESHHLHCLFKPLVLLAKITVIIKMEVSLQSKHIMEREGGG